MLNPIQRALVWVACNVRLGRLTPYLLGLAVLRWPDKLARNDPRLRR
jgi:hypothetical protein